MDIQLSAFKSQFKTALEKNKLGHAYLFTGSNTSILTQTTLEIICDIETFEDQISNDIFFKRLSEGNYSDLMNIDNEDKSIKINDIRKISSFLQMKPVEGAHRIILIKKADMMTIEAQNALLKILEEPYNNSLIILLSETSDAFLPTVLSRVQVLQVNQILNRETQPIPFDEKEIIAYHLQKILLLGDISSIFILSDILISKKNRQKTEIYLSYLYSIFFEISRGKHTNKFNDDEYNKISQFFTELTPHILDKILNTVLDTIKQIKQNASLNLSVQAMLIKIQEDYYAENSRNTV